MEVVELLQNDQDQVLHLPKEYRFKGDKVFIKRMGNAVVLLPVDDPWQPLIDSLDHFSADFMAERQQPDEQSRESLFE